MPLPKRCLGKTGSGKRCKWTTKSTCDTATTIKNEGYCKQHLSQRKGGGVLKHLGKVEQVPAEPDHHGSPVRRFKAAGRSEPWGSETKGDRRGQAKQEIAISDPVLAKTRRSLKTSEEQEEFDELLRKIPHMDATDVELFEHLRNQPVAQTFTAFKVYAMMEVAGRQTN